MKKNLLLLFTCCTFLSFARNVPQRAVSASQFTTEILLSIGAEKQMVGTTFMDNEILPELQEKFAKIPVLSKKYPSKEIFYSINPDFLTGWKSAVDPKNLGSIEELEKNGVQVFFMKSINSNKLEDLFEDINELGKIFNLEKNAQTLVKNMKTELKEIESTLPTKKIKVFAYDSGEVTPFTIGGTGLENTIISLAGGDNIFSDTAGSFSAGNWEHVLVSDPDVIVIVDYGTTSAQEKIKFLKERSPIKNSNAVKNNKFVIIGLGDIAPGVRNIKAIKKLAEAFHGRNNL